MALRRVDAINDVLKPVTFDEAKALMRKYPETKQHVMVTRIRFVIAKFHQPAISREDFLKQWDDVRKNREVMRALWRLVTDKQHGIRDASHVRGLDEMRQR